MTTMQKPFSLNRAATGREFLTTHLMALTLGLTTLAGMFPRLLAFSEVAWTPQSRREYGAFIGRTRAHLPRLKAAGIDYFPAPQLAP
jgi:hypothetical protein